ncbi:DUF916 domain-containing protein [Microbacterium sp. BWT-B31]|uniref:WxL protein peptidoglycan domain-containing protein n=1 Tax=Microbacterium sp. BWT-B31 TaxID=3232072 RepID=UPI0035296EB2
MNTRPLSALAAAAAVVAASVALSVAPAGAALALDDDVSWTVRTASNDFGADRTSYHYTADPGRTVEDAIVIANHGDESVDLALYAADGYTTDSGGFDILTPGETSTAVGAWIQPAEDLVTVEPGASVEVPFTLTVPENATPGDYAGGIVTSLAQPGDTQGLSVDRRLGIRVALRVGGALAPALAVTDLHVAWDGGANPLAVGDARVTYEIENTGNTIISAQQAVSVAGPFGWFRTDAAALDAPPQLLPGEHWTVTTTVPGVGGWLVLLAQASVTPVVVDASGSTNAMAVVIADAAGWAVPWVLLVIVLLIAAAAFFAVRGIRRARIRAKAREDERIEAAVAQALAESEAVPTTEAASPSTV